jgi:hypothetical protein
MPLPIHPVLQLQVRVPGVLVHVALPSQPPLLVAHSFTSLQVTPSPVKPLLHVQVRLPSVLAHAALAEQPPLLVAHSSMSTHWPLSSRYPAVQVKPQADDVHVATECTGCGHAVHRLPHELAEASLTHCWPHAC